MVVKIQLAWSILVSYTLHISIIAFVRVLVPS